MDHPDTPGKGEPYPGNSYDEIPYLVLSHYYTHPDRLATAGTLFGLIPPPVESCRVLELGCASGGNLIPMAYALPGSRFTGVDLSNTQITQGKKYADLLKLANINLYCQDFLNFDPGQEVFDYILVHGVFSWVASQAQEQIFNICQQRLADNGVATISYNVLPGWMMEKQLREMMLYHLRHENHSKTRYQKALELLEFLAREASANNPLRTGTSVNEIYGNLLRSTIERMRQRAEGNENYWIHEYLEENNTPFYFSTVIEMAGQYSLQYLADSDLPSMYANDLSDESRSFLDKNAKTWVEREQYLDFLRNRMFRRSLFCRKEATLTAQPGLEQLQRLQVVSKIIPVDTQVSTLDDTPMVFEVNQENILTFHNPIQKTALVYLSEQLPRPVPFTELAQVTASRLQNPTDQTIPPPRTGGTFSSQEIARVMYLIHTFYPTLINFTTWNPPSIWEVSERPAASAAARLLAATGNPVTNMIHRRVELEAFSRFLLWLLNGERDMPKLVELVELAMKEGKISISSINTNNEIEARNQIASLVVNQLEYFSKRYLLVA